MPNIKSAKKRVITAEKRNLRNKSIKNNLKTNLKKVDIAIENNGDVEEAAKLAIKKIDQAAAKGVMHKKTAARRKSAVARKLNQAKAQ